MRHSLLLLAILSLACAITAPFIRSWEPERQWLFFRAVLINSSIVLCVGVAICLRRFQVEKKCRPIMVVKITHRVGWVRGPVSWLMVFLLPASIVYSGYVASVPTAGFATPSFVTLSPYIMSANFAFLLVPNLLRLCWNLGFHSIEIGEHGIIAASTVFQPWSALRSVTWNREDGLFSWRLKAYYYQQRPLQIPHEYRDQLDAILKRSGLIPAETTTPTAPGSEAMAAFVK
jgi:hypothetical protein